MEYKLTDELISQLCMFKRVAEFLEAHPEEVNSNPEFKNHSVKFCAVMKNIWDSLTEEQQNIVLEEHKRQLKIIENQPSSKKKRKK